jgi:hypothetical protein
MVVSLPAAGWQPVTGGFRYSDKRMVADPVTQALMRAGKVLSVKDKGSGLPFTLDEPSQGTLTVMLHSGDTAWCARFGGIMWKDVPGSSRG